MDHEARFRSIPWCAALLSNPDFTPTVTASREPKASTEDSFFAETLQSDRTIRSCVSLQHNPSSAPDRAIPEVRIILELGDGVNGHPNICHGGFVATVLDEAMGVLLTVNMENDRRRDPSLPGSLTAFTAYLNTKYHKPVPAPGVILATAKFVKNEGRKTYITATVGDGQGTVYAAAEALFIEPRAKL